MGLRYKAVMMTPKERVLAAVRFQGPDRTPYLRWDKLSVTDFIADWARPTDAPAQGPAKWIDEWGCGWETVDNTRGQVFGHPIRSVEDYARLAIPETPLPLEALRANRREYPDRVCTLSLGFFFFERLEKLREFSEFMMDLVAEREAVESLMDRMQAYYIRLVDACADSGLVDCVAVNEDLGIQDRLTISPTMWREIFMPRYRAVYQRARERGLIVFQHSCGYVQDIIGDLATTGVSILELQQLNCMDMEMVAAQALRLHASLVTNRPQLYAGIDELRLYPVAEKRGVGQAPTRAPGATTLKAGEQQQIRMAGSQDFTLDLLASFLKVQDPGLTLARESVGSLMGLLALQQRTAHLAGSHLLDEETGDFNRGYIQHLLTPLGVRVVLLGFVEREQGLIVAPGNPKRIQGLADLRRPDVLFVNRQRGAGTRVLLDYHLAYNGIAAEQVRGYERQEPTHTAVAMTVSEGMADCGLGVLAAARALGLEFVPLFHERFDLVIPVEHYESTLLQPLLAVLRRQDREFVQLVAALGGYATGLMGRVLAEM